ncbi:MAG: carbonic anhydrase [Alphaproteobacteria bacterium]|nr:carbonic anhydrase [Alphaproteobacteria bacterium]
MNAIDRIRMRQAITGVQLRVTIPSQVKPSLLLVGCVDARLNPRDDIGIPDGAALIHRTIAATIPAYDPADSSSREFNDVLTGALAGGIRHIAVMGHTHCGGLEACLCGEHEKLRHVKDHLTPLEPVRAVAQGAREMEDKSVAQIIANIRTYPVVQRAQEQGAVDLHGWVVHTGNKRIRQMDLSRPERAFAPMPPLASLPEKASVIDRIAHQQAAYAEKPAREPQRHEPELIILSDMDAEVNPANDLSIPYGKAIIYRDVITPGDDLPLGKKAAIQFAVEAKGVRDVVVLGHYDSRREGDDYEHACTQVLRRMERLKQFDFLKGPSERGVVKIHGWVFDNAMHPPAILEASQKGDFVPMALPSTKSCSI